MVKVIQFSARLVTLCILWCIVRFTQFLLQLADRPQDANSMGWAEIRLQCDIREMVERAAQKLWERECDYA